MTYGNLTILYFCGSIAAGLREPTIQATRWYKEKVKIAYRSYMVLYLFQVCDVREQQYALYREESFGVEERAVVVDPL